MPSAAFKSIPFTDGLVYEDPNIVLGTAAYTADFTEKTNQTSAQFAYLSADLLNSDGTFHSANSTLTHSLSSVAWSTTGVFRDDYACGAGGVPGTTGRRIRVFSDAGRTQLRMAASTHPDGLSGLVFADGSTYTPAPSTAPVLTAVGELNQISLSWTAVAEATGYRLIRDDLTEFVVAGVAYVDTGLGDGVTHSYTVLAYNGTGDGPVSNTAETTTLSPPPPDNSGTIAVKPINSGCILGCATEYKVLVTNRCGTNTVCELTNISDLTYGRVLDDTSEAVIVMDLAGDEEESTCCDCVGDVRSWIHSVMVLRDGALVWGPGPVVNVVYRKEQVAITARDVSAWMDVRLLHNDMDFIDEDPLVIAQALIDDAMAPDDPCGVAAGTFIQAPAVLGVIDREYLVTDPDPTQYAGDAFRELARTSIDYTVVGSTIIMGEPLSFGPYTTLTDEDFLVEIEVEERGLEAATKWTVQSDLARGEAGGLDPYYGLVEQLAEESEVDDDDQAALIATNRLVASNPAPLYVNVPEGAQLSPRSAVCFEQLVPGTLFNVNLRGLCRQVYTQLKLTAVKVHVADGGDEEVGITLSPLGTAFGEAVAP